MKVGVITDIHNNLEALKSILCYFKEQSCEQIFCCGDIIGIGPEPEETVQLLMSVPNLVAVKGNHDDYLINGLPEFAAEINMAEEEFAHHQWEHSRLSNQSIEYLKGLPFSQDIELEGVKITIVHYGMKNKREFASFKFNPTIEDCKSLFSDIRADVILYGHDHELSINQNESVLYANFGSLGCPGKEKNTARAGILTLDKGKFTYEKIKIEYNVEKVINNISNQAYPAHKSIKNIFYGIK